MNDAAIFALNPTYHWRVRLTLTTLATLTTLILAKLTTLTKLTTLFYDSQHHLRLWQCLV